MNPRTQAGSAFGSQQFASFVLAGALAAAANIGSRWLLQPLLGFQVAIVPAYLLGMVTAFVLARTFVFPGNQDAAHNQFARFALVNAVSLAQVWLVSVMLAFYLLPRIGWTWHSETVAHIVGVASPVALSYILHKHYSFRSA